MKNAIFVFAVALSVIFSGVLLSAPAAFACPQLAGDFTCVNLDNGASSAVGVTQNVYSSGLNSFFITGLFGSLYFLSDGVSYPSTTPSSPTSHESHSANCFGNQLIVQGSAVDADNSRNYETIFEATPQGMSITTNTTQTGKHSYTQLNRFDCN